MERDDEVIDKAHALVKEGPFATTDGDCQTCGANPYNGGGTGDMRDHGSHVYGCPWVELDRVLRDRAPDLYEGDG